VAQWAADARFASGLACASVLRFLSEHVGALPLSAAVRLMDTHDVMLCMVPLIECPPTVRRVVAADGPPPAPARQLWHKYVGNAWVAVAPGELLRLTPAEAAPWLTLYNLACDPGCRSRYALHSHRRGTLLRVRKYLTVALLEQLPLLEALQRYLDELALLVVPEPPPSAQAGVLLLQAVPLVHEAVLRRALAPPLTHSHALGKQSGEVGGGGVDGSPCRQAACARLPPAPPTTAACGGRQVGLDWSSSSSSGADSSIDPAAAIAAAPPPRHTAPSSTALLALESTAGGSGGSPGDRLRALVLVNPPAAAATARGGLPLQHSAGGASARGSTPGWSWEDAARWCAHGLVRSCAAELLSAAPAAVHAASSSYSAPGAPDTTTHMYMNALDDEAFLSAVAGPPKCERCGAAGPSVKRCSRCRNAYYCSRDCQTASWSAHAPLCDTVAGGGSKKGR